MGRRKNFTGQSFWARGYYVSTVGKDEEAVREYIKHQEEEDRRIEQLNLLLDRRHPLGGAYFNPL
jgi:putative transposase